MKKTALLVLKIIMYAQAVIWFLFGIANSILVPIGNYRRTFIIVLLFTYLSAVTFAILAILLKYWNLPVKLLVFLFQLANAVLTFAYGISFMNYVLLSLNLGALICFAMSAFPLHRKE